MMKTSPRACARASEVACPQAPGFNADESPLAWLRRRKDKAGRPLISDAEFDAGERLRSDFTLAQMAPRVTANWSLLLSEGGGRRGAPDHGPELRDAVIAARMRVQRALAAAGPDLAGVLIDVCCHLRGLEMQEKSCGWPQRSGKIILGIALRALARHYGMLRDEPAARGPAKVRHWGADGYRPVITPNTAEG